MLQVKGLLVYIYPFYWLMTILGFRLPGKSVKFNVGGHYLIYVPGIFISYYILISF